MKCLGSEKEGQRSMGTGPVPCSSSLPDILQGHCTAQGCLSHNATQPGSCRVDGASLTAIEKEAWVELARQEPHSARVLLASPSPSPDATAQVKDKDGGAVSPMGDLTGAWRPVCSRPSGLLPEQGRHSRAFLPLFKWVPEAGTSQPICCPSPTAGKVAPP